MKRSIFIVALLFLLLFFALFSNAFLPEKSDFFWSRVALGGLFVVFIGLRLVQNIQFAGKTVEPWRQLAAQTGLVCQTAGFKSMLGYPIYVSGAYRGRWLALYAWGSGRLQPPSTRIEVEISNQAGVQLWFRGPYPDDEIGFDNAIGNFFSAGEYRLDHRRFFSKSKPENLAIELFGANGQTTQKPLLAQLRKLQRDVNIEVDGFKLYFDQVGLLTNVEYLHFLFDLLADLAEAVEQSKVT